MNNTPESKFFVVSVRKSDGKVFFPDGANDRNGINNLTDAFDVATLKAQKNSRDYRYVIYRCDPYLSVEQDEIPTKVTYY